MGVRFASSVRDLDARRRTVVFPFTTGATLDRLSFVADVERVSPLVVAAAGLGRRRALSERRA